VKSMERREHQAKHSLGLHKLTAAFPHSQQPQIAPSPIRCDIRSCPTPVALGCQYVVTPITNNSFSSLLSILEPAYSTRLFAIDQLTVGVSIQYPNSRMWWWRFKFYAPPNINVPGWLIATMTVMISP
jgi:hypothetical protein